MIVYKRGSEIDNSAYISKLQDQDKANNPLAQYELGKIYYDGIGVNRNHKIAKEYWIKSANNGYSQAQYSLGYLYLFGEGIILDYKEGCKWLKLASEQNHSEAMLLYKKRCFY